MSLIISHKGYRYRNLLNSLLTVRKGLNLSFTLKETKTIDMFSLIYQLRKRKVLSIAHSLHKTRTHQQKLMIDVTVNSGHKLQTLC